jgi:hypothetical protein
MRWKPSSERWLLLRDFVDTTDELVEAGAREREVSNIVVQCSVPEMTSLRRRRAGLSA